PANPAVWETFSKGLFYHQSQFDDPDGYERLAQLLEQLDRERGTRGNHIFYLATPPSFYGAIADNLSASGLARRDSSGGPSWSRIIIEKPFGHDLQSALALNRELNKAFKEKQIF